MTLYILTALFFSLLIAYIYFKLMIQSPKDRGQLTHDIKQQISQFEKAHEPLTLKMAYIKNGELVSNVYGTKKDCDESKYLFQIGSLSKLITATIFDALVQEGIVSEHTTLNDTYGSELKLSDNVKNINLKQLANHTSGLPRLPKTLLKKMQQLSEHGDLAQNPYAKLQLRDVYDYLENANEQTKLGQFSYSNLGSGLLGHILEKVTQKPLEQLAKEHIFNALKMKHTGIAISSEQAANFVQGLDADGNAVNRWDFDVLAGAGAFYSSLDDMLKFAQFRLYDRSTNGWIAPTFKDKMLNNKQIIWHNGMVNGFASYLSIDRKNQNVVLILANKPLILDNLGSKLMQLVRTQSH